MSEDVPQPPEHIGPSHYYGDQVRILFVVCAGLIIAAQVIGKPFFTPLAALFSAVILVVCAGLTNPVQTWIHYVNSFVAGVGLLLCASIVLDRYKSDPNFLLNSFIVIILTLLFITALYSAVKTLRGALMRDAPTVM